MGFLSLERLKIRSIHAFTRTVKELKFSNAYRRNHHPYIKVVRELVFFLFFFSLVGDVCLFEIALFTIALSIAIGPATNARSISA